jgi:predicted nuclease of predicted toxin-antitoxin system
VHFFVDAQLPPLLCEFFKRRGFNAQHAFELFEHTASDERIFTHAQSMGAVIVTKDDDFARRSDALGAPPQILWLRIGNCRNQALLSTLANAWSDILSALERGERIVEVRASS